MVWCADGGWGRRVGAPSCRLLSAGPLQTASHSQLPSCSLHRYLSPACGCGVYERACALCMQLCTTSVQRSVQQSAHLSVPRVALHAAARSARTPDMGSVLDAAERDGIAMLHAGSRRLISPCSRLRPERARPHPPPPWFKRSPRAGFAITSSRSWVAASCAGAGSEGKLGIGPRPV